MEKLEALSQKLSSSSIKNFNNPYTSIEWDESLSDDFLFFSPEQLSVYYHPIFKTLNKEQVRDLSLREACNFFSLNIHGEKELIQGLTKKLYAYSPAISSYLHHFIDEENKHMLWFGSFCERYLGKVYEDKKIFFPKEYVAGEEEFLFFSKVVIFEEIVDFYNVSQAKDERLHPLVRKIHAQHHRDESRHLAFGRQMCRELFDQFSKQWSDKKRVEIGSYLESYMVSTWREYYNPDVYMDMQLANPFDLFEEVYNLDQAREFRKLASLGPVKFFNEFGYFQEMKW